MRPECEQTNENTVIHDEQNQDIIERRLMQDVEKPLILFSCDLSDPVIDHKNANSLRKP